ncbi:hypothetical protein K9512_001109 [Vibrio parahaemolyticus]|nr:hypothetical protein [Vibrio parahaemolyticus]
MTILLTIIAILFVLFFVLPNLLFIYATGTTPAKAQKVFEKANHTAINHAKSVLEPKIAELHKFAADYEYNENEDPLVTETRLIKLMNNVIHVEITQKKLKPDDDTFISQCKKHFIQAHYLLYLSPF